jgi:hypothetical protein
MSTRHRGGFEQAEEVALSVRARRRQAARANRARVSKRSSPRSGSGHVTIRARSWQRPAYFAARAIRQIEPTYSQHTSFLNPSSAYSIKK